MHGCSVELGADVLHHKELHGLLFEDLLCWAFTMLNIWESAAVCFLLKSMELLKEENTWRGVINCKPFQKYHNENNLVLKEF